MHRATVLAHCMVPITHNLPCIIIANAKIIALKDLSLITTITINYTWCLGYLLHILLLPILRLLITTLQKIYSEFSTKPHTNLYTHQNDRY